MAVSMLMSLMLFFDYLMGGIQRLRGYPDIQTSIQISRFSPGGDNQHRKNPVCKAFKGLPIFLSSIDLSTQRGSLHATRTLPDAWVLSSPFMLQWKLDKFRKRLKHPANLKTLQALQIHTNGNSQRKLSRRQHCC